MSPRKIIVPSLVLLIASNLAACSQSVEESLAAENPAVTEQVQVMPAAGDDFTLYISGRFAEAEQPAVSLSAKAAHEAPAF
jgi:hypothetical protein